MTSFFSPPPTDKQGLIDHMISLGLSVTTNNPLQTYWMAFMKLLDHEVTKICEAVESTVQNIIITESPPGTQPPDATAISRVKEMIKRDIEHVSWEENDMKLSPTAFYRKFLLNISSTAFSSPTGKAYAMYRDMYEHIDPSSQCDAIERKVITNKGFNICYICGATMTGIPPPSGCSAECEHILPAFTALGIGGLLQSANINTDIDLDIIQHEYANSHKCCNQSKLDSIWINYNTSTGRYEVNERNIYDVLNKICENIRLGKHGCDELLKCYDSRINICSDAWKKSRVAYIRATYLNGLCNIMNGQKEEYGEFYDLSIRMRQLTALRIDIVQIANAYLGRPASVANVETKSLTKDEALKLLRTFFTDKACKDILFKNITSYLTLSNDDVALCNRKFGIGRGDRTSGRVFNVRKNVDNLYPQLYTAINPILNEAETAINQLYVSSGDQPILEDNVLPTINGVKEHLITGISSYLTGLWAATEGGTAKFDNDIHLSKISHSKIIGGSRTALEDEMLALCIKDMVNSLEFIERSDPSSQEFYNQIKTEIGYYTRSGTYHRPPVYSVPGSPDLRRWGDANGSPVYWRLDADGIRGINPTNGALTGTGFPWHDPTTRTIQYIHRNPDGTPQSSTNISFLGGKHKKKPINKTKKQQFNKNKYTMKTKPNKKQKKLKIKKQNLRNKYSKQNK